MLRLLNIGFFITGLMINISFPIVICFKSEQINLGTPITKMASNIHFSDIFVGGENFIASLSQDLHVIFYLSIGPVTEEAHCHPEPAPCSNTVQVLEIDEAYNKLIVCGSAYEGTCTMHSIPNICDWMCVDAAINESNSNIVSTFGERRTVTHFITPREVDMVFEPFISIDHLLYDCRSSQFAQQCNMAIPAPEGTVSVRRKARDVTTDYKDSTKNDDNFDSDFMPQVLDQPVISVIDPNDFEPFEFGRTFESRIVVASFQNDGWSDTMVHHPLISVRYVKPIMEESFRMIYSGGEEGNQAQGIFISPEKRADFKTDFRMSFSRGNYSYILSVQKGFCSEDGKEYCVMLSRMNNLSPSLVPYVELPLSCSYDGVEYPLLTAAVHGIVGLQYASAYEEVPILILAFGKGSGGNADPKYGTAICAHVVNNLDWSEFSYTQEDCELYTGYNSEPVPWSVNNPEKPCQIIRAKSFGGDDEAITFLDKTVVTALLTHTQTIPTHRGNVWLEKMYLYAVHKQLSGIKLSKHFVLTVTKSDSEYQVQLSVVPTNIKNDFEANNDLVYTPIGKVDHSRAMLYLAYGKEFYILSLDFCRQYTSCSTCQEQGGKQCQWCPGKKSCMDSNSAFKSCQSSSEGSCPPRLRSFFPKSVPVVGGSTLTIRGTHLGSSKSGSNVRVSICDQPCGNVIANVNSLTCTVKPRPKCQSCDKCFINVTVTGSKDSYGNGSSLNQLAYVIPTVTTFSPTFGPVTGGTILEVWGDNLNIGDKRQVKVAGIPCVVPNEWDDDEKVMCQLEEATGHENVCGPVAVKFDKYIIQSRIAEYCFKPDPVITTVSPMSTIESGGVTLFVEGYNFNSTTNLDLVLSIQPDKDQALVTSKRIITSRCTKGNDSVTLTCVTPNIRNVTKLIFDRQPAVNEIKASIYFDLAGAKAKPSSLDYFFIHRDPILHPFLEDHDDSIIYPRLKDKLFKILGNYIPYWMNVSDVVVMVGKTRCHVERMTEYQILCNVVSVLKAYRRDYNNRLLRTTTELPLNTSQALSSTYSEPTTPSSIPTTSTEMFNLSSSTPFLTPPPDTTKSSTVVNKTESITVAVTTKSSTVVNKTTTVTENPDTDYEAILMYGKEVPRQKRRYRGDRLPIVYEIKIMIGNWKQHLGFVTVGPLLDPEKVPPQSKAQIQWTPKLIGIIAGGATTVVILVFLISCIILLYKRNKAKENPFYMGSLSGHSLSHTGSGEPAIPSLSQILYSVLEPSKRDAATTLIIDLNKLTLGKTIGSGNFGHVYVGSLNDNSGSPQKVAVKTLQEPVAHSINLTGFVQEAVIMMDFYHENVLGLIGLAEKEPGVPYVILPYMENGDLLTYVRDHKRSLSLYDVIQFGADICNGMAYLSSLKFVHRDLAARNCMLDMYYRVKVADFGLCRDIYEKGYYTSDNKKKLPIRWMAIESIESGAYSSKSDVWSMGVVMWELLTRGMTPYPGVDGWDIINFLRRRRLAPPLFCPNNLYCLMMTCWAKDQTKRPTFKALQKELLLMIGKEVVSTPATPEPMRNQHVLFPKNTYQDIAPALNTYIIPKIKVSGGDSIPDISNAMESNESVMSLPKSNMIKNAKISIPACYEFRDVKKEAAADYLQLVDNYEPAPRFANPFLRSKKRRNKSSGKSKEKNSKEINVHKTSKNSGNKIDSGYNTVPVDLSPKRYTVPKTSSEGQLTDVDRKDGVSFNKMDSDAYYVLENRASGVSILDGSNNSSVMFDKTASMGSILDRYSGTSSMAASCQSIASSNSSVHFSRRPHSNHSSDIINIRNSNNTSVRKSWKEHELTPL